MPTTIAPVSERPSGAAIASSTDSRLEIAATRERQTEKPAAPFRDVLAGGVSLLMSGAEVATHVVAGPVMAAAVHDARIGAVGSISGSSGGVGALGVGATFDAGPLPSQPPAREPAPQERRQACSR